MPASISVVLTSIWTNVPVRAAAGETWTKVDEGLVLSTTIVDEAVTLVPFPAWRVAVSPTDPSGSFVVSTATLKTPAVPEAVPGKLCEPADSVTDATPELALAETCTVTVPRSGSVALFPGTPMTATEFCVVEVPAMHAPELQTG